MKKFRLIEAPDPSIDRNVDPVRWQINVLNYANLIREVLKVPLNRAAGASIDEMRRSIRVLDALEGKQVGDILELEDADWEHLRAKALNMPWGMDDRRFLQFVLTIENATDTVLDEPPAATPEPPVTASEQPTVAAA